MSQPVALITGASVGIGHACAHKLADEGYKLVLLARRADKLRELADQLEGAPCHLIACDITDREAVMSELDQLPSGFNEIDVLLNNAGLALGLSSADQANWEDWQTMIETNCMSLAFLTRQILPGMRERNRGYVINMGSTAGTYAYPGVNVYGASKAFVEQFSMSLRSDLLGSKVRVCNIEPGLIGGTEFSNVRFHGDDDRAAAMYQNCEPLMPEDIAETVRWILAQPEHVNVNKIEVMPTCQAPIGLSVSKD